jgi:hypothetical protein
MAGEQRAARSGAGTASGLPLLLRVCRLATRDGVRLSQALLLLAEVEARLRLFGFERQRQWLSNPPPMGRAQSRPEPSLSQAQAIAVALRRASRFVPRARCLHRSLALLIWLRRRGAMGELRLGVRTGAGSIVGHAWVERDGVALDEPDGDGPPFALLEPVRPTPPAGGS